MRPVVWHVRGASKGSTGSGLASVHAGDVCVVVCDEPHEESSVCCVRAITTSTHWDHAGTPVSEQPSGKCDVCDARFISRFVFMAGRACAHWKERGTHPVRAAHTTTV